MKAVFRSLLPVLTLRVKSDGKGRREASNGDRADDDKAILN